MPVEPSIEALELSVAQQLVVPPPTHKTALTDLEIYRTTNQLTCLHHGLHEKAAAVPERSLGAGTCPTAHPDYFEASRVESE